MTITQPAPETARWSLEGYARKYPWPQCKYCGRAQDHDCAAVECLLCGTVQCHGSRPACTVCLVGWKPGWSRTYNGGSKCGYAGCDADAVATIRKKRACATHAAKAKVNGMPMTDYLAERIAHRDSGKGWEHWRLVA